jgi:hypothetical protein
MATATQHNLVAEGLFPKPSGDPGSGKTHGTRAMLHLHPQEWIKSTTLSDKGPYYAPNRYDGMIFFSDDRETSEGQEEFMRRAYSDFQRRQRHTTLTRDLKGIEVEAPARSITYLTSVSDKFSEAMADRLIDTGMDDTDKQRERVLKAQTRRVRDGRPLLPEDDKILVAREILRDVMARTFKVKIPFAARLKWSTPPGSREAAQFYDMIMAMAILRYKQRQTNEQGEILATVEDYNDALALYKLRGRSMHSRLADAELALCTWCNGRGEMDAHYIADNYKPKGREKKYSYQFIHRLLNGEGGNPGLVRKVTGFHKRRVSEPSGTQTVYKDLYSLTGFDPWKEAWEPPVTLVDEPQNIDEPELEREDGLPPGVKCLAEIKDKDGGGS